MLIANAESLATFLRKNRDVAKWMAVWTEVVLATEWNNLADVRLDYPSADGVQVKDGATVTVFNAKGNTYRLLTRISYEKQIVRVVDIMTHAEYSKGRWKS